jgi:DNA-binding PadR family transcriptional regulator
MHRGAMYRGVMHERDAAPRPVATTIRDPGVLILTSLAGGPRHGYAIVEDIARFAGVRLGPGTLYGALARLETADLIEALGAEDRRRPYRLTALGAALLGRELEAMERIAGAARERLPSVSP